MAYQWPDFFQDFHPKKTSKTSIMPIQWILKKKNLTLAPGA